MRSYHIDRYLEEASISVGIGRRSERNFERNILEPWLLRHDEICWGMQQRVVHEGYLLFAFMEFLCAVYEVEMSSSRILKDLSDHAHSASKSYRFD